MHRRSDSASLSGAGLDSAGRAHILRAKLVGPYPATYAYAAFGSTRASTGSVANEVRFTGERTDTESGLEFLRARTYDPATGTFLQRDTWGITPTDSQSIDAYVYTANDPANSVDHSGHMALAVGQDSAGGGGGAIEVAAGAGGAVVVVSAAYTVASAPVGIANDWARAGAGWLASTWNSWTKSPVNPRPYQEGPPQPKARPGPPPGRSTDYNPNPDPVGPGGPETGPVGPGNPYKGLPPLFKNVAKWALKVGGLSLISDALFGVDTHEGPDTQTTCQPKQCGSPSPGPSPSPSPTPSPTNGPGPSPSPPPVWVSGC
jgi:RHS repeat-associated protein